MIGFAPDTDVMRKKLALENCQSDVELVYADLTDSFACLNDARPSPVNVRRAFTNFVNLTQKVTAAMYRDYSARTGKKWNEADFSGWNPVTKVFESLRDISEHDAAILILVHERHTIKPFPESSALLSFEGTWELHDQLIDMPPDAIAAVRADPDTGEPTDDVIDPYSRGRTLYSLPPSLSGLCRCVTDRGSRRVMHDSCHGFELATQNYTTTERGRGRSE